MTSNIKEWIFALATLSSFALTIYSGLYAGFFLLFFFGATENLLIRVICVLFATLIIGIIFSGGIITTRIIMERWNRVTG